MKLKANFQTFMEHTFLSVLGSLGVSCYILADTFFISLGCGANGLTALNLAVPLYNFIHGTGLMIGMGAATKFSIYQSQKQKKEGNVIYTHALILAFVFSLFFVGLGLFASYPLASWLGADAQTLEMTNTYLYWLLLFAPAFILNDIFLCFVRNDGSPKLSMIAMVIGSLSNVVLDYVFIFPLDMGIFGAILATGLSPLISIGILLGHWIQKKNTFHLEKGPIQLPFLRQTLVIGFPSLVTQLSGGIVMIVFNYLILGLAGNIGVAAYGITANIAFVVVAIFTGIAQGVQPLTSAFYGAGELAKSRKMLRYMLATSLVCSMLLYGLICGFAPWITAVFNSENYQSLQQISETGLRIYFLSLPFMGVNIGLSLYFASIEKAIPSYILSLCRGFILILPMAFLLAAWQGMTGIWLTYPVTELLTTLLGIFLYCAQKEKREKKSRIFM